MTLIKHLMGYLCPNVLQVLRTLKNTAFLDTSVGLLFNSG